MVTSRTVRHYSGGGFPGKSVQGRAFIVPDFQIGIVTVRCVLCKAELSSYPISKSLGSVPALQHFSHFSRVVSLHPWGTSPRIVTFFLIACTVWQIPRTLPDTLDDMERSGPAVLARRAVRVLASGDLTIPPGPGHPPGQTRFGSVSLPPENM